RKDIGLRAAGKAMEEDGVPSKRHTERGCPIVMGRTAGHALAARPMPAPCLAKLARGRLERRCGAAWDGNGHRAGSLLALRAPLVSGLPSVRVQEAFSYRPMFHICSPPIRCNRSSQHVVRNNWMGGCLCRGRGDRPVCCAGLRALRPRLFRAAEKRGFIRATGCTVDGNATDCWPPTVVSRIALSVDDPRGRSAVSATHPLASGADLGRVALRSPGDKPRWRGGTRSADAGDRAGAW